MASNSGLDQIAGIGIGGKEYLFKIKDLIEKAKNYPIQELSPEIFEKQLSERIEDPQLTQSRAMAADLKYPIIVIKAGSLLWIADGTHRAQKALNLQRKLLNEKALSLRSSLINAYIIPIEDMAQFEVPSNYTNI